MAKPVYPHNYSPRGAPAVVIRKPKVRTAPRPARTEKVRMAPRPPRVR